MFVLIVPLEDWFCSYPEKSWKKMFDLFISPGLESTWEAWCRRLWWILDWMGSSTRHTCRDFFINYNANTVNIVAATCMGQTACLVQYTDGTDWGCIKNGRILSILISLFFFCWGVVGGGVCVWYQNPQSEPRGQNYWCWIEEYVFDKAVTAFMVEQTHVRKLHACIYRVLQSPLLIKISNTWLNDFSSQNWPLTRLISYIAMRMV